MVGGYDYKERGSSGANGTSSRETLASRQISPSASRVPTPGCCPYGGAGRRDEQLLSRVWDDGTRGAACRSSLRQRRWRRREYLFETFGRWIDLWMDRVGLVSRVPFAPNPVLGVARAVARALGRASVCRLVRVSLPRWRFPNTLDMSPRVVEVLQILLRPIDHRVDLTFSCICAVFYFGLFNA